MSPTEQIQLGLVINAGLKTCLSVLAAALCIYFGFRLFLVAQALPSDMEASGTWGKLRLQQAAPGTFFTLFGCTVLIVALLQHAEVKESVPLVPAATVDTPAPFVNSVDFGAMGGQMVDPSHQCAKLLHYALLNLRGQTGELAIKDPTRGISQSLSDIETVDGNCIDASLGAGSYQTYKVVSNAKAEGNVNGYDQKELNLYDKVSAFLAS